MLSHASAKVSSPSRVRMSRLCLKEELPVLSTDRDRPENMSSDVKSSAKAETPTPARSLPSPDPQWGGEGKGSGGKQTISSNLNLFKVTERVRKTDWH